MKIIRISQIAVIFILFTNPANIYAARAADEKMTPAPPATTMQKEPSKETGESIEPYTAEQRDEAMKKAKSSMDEFDKRMEKLERRMKENKEAAIDELKKARHELAVGYENLKRSTKETWEDMKTRFVKAYDELEQKFKKAEEENKSEKPPETRK